MKREPHVPADGRSDTAACSTSPRRISGVKLGLYRSLAEDGPATAAELAARTGTNERLVREWLEQQGATELLDATHEGGEWRFALPSGHAAVLLDPDALDGVDGAVRSLIADLAQVPRLVESFRTGEGIPYADYGPDEAEGQALGTRPVYRAEIESWLAAVPELTERLKSGTARVLDIGCGLGWSSVCMAKAYPGMLVDGVDLDPGSIEAAKGSPSPRAWRTACVSSFATPPPWPGRATTSRPCSRCSTTWPGRSRCSAPPGRPSTRTASSWSPTSRAVTPSPGRPTTRNGAASATACCTASPRA